MRWRSVGPARGGRSIAAGGSDSRPNEYWFGATGGGAWKTTDGGENWEPMTDGKITSSSIGSLAVCQSNPDVVYIGGGETQFRGNIIQGDGIYKTTDGGKTWTHLPQLRDSQAIARIRAASHQLRHRLCGGVRAGLQRPPGARRLQVHRRRPDVQEDAVPRREDRRRRPLDRSEEPERDLRRRSGRRTAARGACRAAAPAAASSSPPTAATPGPRSRRTPDCPPGIWGKVGVSVSPVDGNRVYALIENEKGGLYVSDDAGATWKLINENRNLRQRAFYYTRVVADTKEKDTVYVLNVQFFKSTDGGKTTTTIRVPHGDNHDLWISPDRQPAHGAVQRRRRQRLGQRRPTWTDQDFPTGQFYNVFTTRHVPYHVCGAQQDNSTACVGSQANPGAGEGSLPPIFYAVGGGESGYIAPDPNDLNVFYAGSYGGFLSRLDRETGQQRAVNIYPEQPDGLLLDRHQGTVPVDVSRSCSRRWTARRCTPRRSTCGAPPTAGRAGRRSART